MIKSLVPLLRSVLIIDFGSQYTQLIARKVRELNVYSEILPYSKIPTDFSDYQAVILSGSPFSVYHEKAPQIPLQSLRGKIPTLGICYGAQYLAHSEGGKVEASKIREYGRAHLTNISDNLLFKDIQEGSQIWMSHGDTIMELPASFERIAGTETVENAAYKIHDEPTYALQFHPEVYHSTDGKKLLENFLTNIAHIKKDWTPVAQAEEIINELKIKLGNDKVVLGLSGGSDSTVAAVLLQKAIGKNLHCIFVNNGLLRLHEFDHVLKQYEGMGLQVHGIDASARFLKALKGISDPESKRKIIGNEFINVFDEEAHKIKEVKWLAQGTIYSDVIESAVSDGPAQTIKSHHNVGGLPDFMKLKIVEPLRMLFKDEVRTLGSTLGIKETLIHKHPFPGPGLGIRVLGEVTPEKVFILQKADAIFIDLLKKWNLYDKVWQAGAMLLPVQSVGVMGDERTYENTIALRAVTSTDGMTADWADLPYQFLQEVSNAIINQVKGINRVVYDISSKPPATIEWE
jgi:GMP synthase (glutamine-hydrolysing)